MEKNKWAKVGLALCVVEISKMVLLFTNLVDNHEHELLAGHDAAL